MSDAKQEKSLILPLLIAVINLGVFGLMFAAMHYFEFMGADPQYFDDGTINNIKNINMITGLLGIEIDPNSQARVSTVFYAVCLGVALISSAVAIMIANRQADEVYEVTDAV